MRSATVEPRSLQALVVLVFVLTICVACQADRVDVGCAEDDDCDDGETCSANHVCESPETDPDPAKSLLDDFEDGDPNPVDPDFQGWQHYSYNPPGQDVYSTPSVISANASNFGMEVEFRLEDPPDGSQQYPGGGLRTVAKNGYVDLSSYSRLVFQALYEETEAECVPLDRVIAYIGCAEYGTHFELQAAVTSEYKTATLQLQDFEQPSYVATQPVDVMDCFAVADGLAIHFQPDLADGECGAGRLFFDNFSFR